MSITSSSACHTLSQQASPKVMEFHIMSAPFFSICCPLRTINLTKHTFQAKSMSRIEKNAHRHPSPH